METDLLSSVIKSVIFILLLHRKLTVRILPVVEIFLLLLFLFHSLCNASNVMLGVPDKFIYFYAEYV